jgi:hypothetical protein
MEPIPLPSHVHYELLLQLLERQTAFAVNQQPAIREQVQQLIVTLRKAIAQQKHIEQTCEQSKMSVEYRWSLNNYTAAELPPDPVSLKQEPNV